MTWSKDDWNTPQYILDAVRQVGPIVLDPCWNSTSLTNALHRYDGNGLGDGIVHMWDYDGLVFVNPPYSRNLFLLWAEKIVHEANNGAEIIALVPANVETRAWQNHLWDAKAVCFPSKRIKFLIDGKPKGSPPGPHAICYFGKRTDKFIKVFRSFGRIIFPSFIKNKS